MLCHWLDHFYGYGSWKAPIWFVGYEESGGDLPEEVAEKLGYFALEHRASTGPALCDVRRLYAHVAFRTEGPRAERFNTLYDYRFGRSDSVLHGLWKNLIAFAHAYRGLQPPDLLAYQRTRFLLPEDASEALIQLYPLPAHNHAWYYSWLDLPELPFLKSRTRYEQHVFPTRISCILEKIREHKPEVVLMFGMKDINTLKERVQSVFSPVKFTMVKAIKHQIPQHHHCEVNGTKLILTTQIPALKHNRVETGFDWEAVARTLAS